MILLENSGAKDHAIEESVCLFVRVGDVQPIECILQ